MRKQNPEKALAFLELAANGIIMKQDTEKVRTTYDSVAEEYALTFSGEHEKKPQDMEILRRFSQLMGNRRPVWDLGCGPGQTSAYLKKLGVDISGLDLSMRIIEQAAKLHPGINFRQGNMLELDFPDRSIAGIVSFYSIVHFTEEQVVLALSEVFRILEPGGLLLLTYHCGDETIHIDEFLGRKVDVDFMFFRSDFISGSLKNCGFENIEITEREPYPEVEYQSRRAYVFAVKPGN